METAFGYKAAAADSDSGVRPADRWREAKHRQTKGKKTPRVNGGMADQREARIASVAEDIATRRSTHVICPECSAPYSRGHISKHRGRLHGVHNRRGVALNYDPAPRPTKVTAKLICPDCQAAIPRSMMSVHRRNTHGVTSPRGRHLRYEPA
jgi:endogenous inhibitor of DNA gyrase (YacG/DUF329 family)